MVFWYMHNISKTNVWYPCFLKAWIETKAYPAKIKKEALHVGATTKEFQ